MAVDLADIAPLMMAFVAIAEDNAYETHVYIRPILSHGPRSYQFYKQEQGKGRRAE